ncbi:MAG: nicotinate phosphoribosyltransferase [Lachnospiraceae bacterium]|nr:nicotinate phosphoribosyltransferase [Lachnospiraceae bacterium]
MKQFDKRNLSMVMDLYELTMANGYFNGQDTDSKVAFDVFYRRNPFGGGFGIFAGLEQIVEYINDLHFDDEDIKYLDSLGIFTKDFLEYLRDFKFKGDMYAFPEGTVMYPNEPLITVVAPLIDAQLVETAILAQINHQSLVATKTQRIVKAAGDKAVSDFGARRAHNMDAAVYGARAAYIGGAVGTATVLAGQMFDIPVSGTMAHSFIMYYKDEYEAFKNYALNYPDSSVFLVDTYDTLKSGIPNAIKVAKEVLEPMGKRLKGIRIDSGDLAYLSIQTRKMLDEAGMEDCKIIVSNSLDEHTISSLNNQGAKIDSYGVGERLITGAPSAYDDEPISLLGAVYKIAAVEENGKFSPRIKISGNVEKITNPGLKKVYRIYDETGKAKADLLAMADETVDLSGEYRAVAPTMPWKNITYSNCTAKELQVKIFENGKLIYKLPTLKEIRDYVKEQLVNEIWEEEQRFINPHTHYLDMTPDYYRMKNKELEENSK